MASLVLPRALKRALVSIAALGLSCTGVMGFAHTKAGRPLLALMGHGAAKDGCPFGYDVAASPEQKEAARQRFAASHAGASRASQRPALGFTLDGTTREEVRAWASSRGITCKVPRSGPDLDCADVPSSALPEAFHMLARATNMGNDFALTEEYRSLPR
ncbi:MAG: hypothetical protein ABI193_12030 [Minicystis sp.]